MIFDDDLVYSEKNWTYCTAYDPRFAEEVQMNVYQVSQSIVTSMDNWADAAIENSLYPENYGSNKYSDFFN